MAINTKHQSVSQSKSTSDVKFTVIYNLFIKFLLRGSILPAFLYEDMKTMYKKILFQQWEFPPI